MLGRSEDQGPPLALQVQRFSRQIIGEKFNYLISISCCVLQVEEGIQSDPFPIGLLLEARSDDRESSSPLTCKAFGGSIETSCAPIK
jgi:hypothetical protein